VKARHGAWGFVGKKRGEKETDKKDCFMRARNRREEKREASMALNARKEEIEGGGQQHTPLQNSRK